MNNLFKLTAVALLAGVAGTAHADLAETKGGLKIKTEDGRFEGALAGRIHFDYASISEDIKDEGADKDGFYTRRAYLTFTGKLYGYKYKLEADLKKGVEAKEMWIGTDLAGGLLMIGHNRPAYAMEGMTSSNDILFIERPFISNNTVFSGREYQNAVRYDYHSGGFGVKAAYYTANPDQDKDAGETPNSGNGYSARVTFAPIMESGSVVHIGASYDLASYANDGDGADIKAKPAAKNGPSYTLVHAADYDEQSTITAEAGVVFGPLYAQGEYSVASFDGAGGSQDVTAYYVQAGYFLTGESRGYKVSKGGFVAPKPAGDKGAIELKARYDFVENSDAALNPEASVLSFGVNYYVNPQVRFMLDYNMAQYSEDGADDDKPEAIVARAQLKF